MTTVMNDNVRGTTTTPANADDLEPKIFAHWDATVGLNLCDTVPIDTID